MDEMAECGCGSRRFRLLVSRVECCECGVFYWFRDMDHGTVTFAKQLVGAVRKMAVREKRQEGSS